MSGSKSGMNAKSMVELSPTAFKLRLVLKCLTLAPVSEASGTGMVAEAGKRGVLGDERAPAMGLSEVRREEKVAGPVMESWRVVVLLVPAARARVNARVACCMVAV